MLRSLQRKAVELRQALQAADLERSEDLGWDFAARVASLTWQHEQLGQASYRSVRDLPTNSDLIVGFTLIRHQLDHVATMAVVQGWTALACSEPTRTLWLAVNSNFSQFPSEEVAIPLRECRAPTGKGASFAQVISGPQVAHSRSQLSGSVSRESHGLRGSNS